MLVLDAERLTRSSRFSATRTAIETRMAMSTKAGHRNVHSKDGYSWSRRLTTVSLAAFGDREPRSRAVNRNSRPPRPSDGGDWSWGSNGASTSSSGGQGGSEYSGKGGGSRGQGFSRGGGQGSRRDADDEDDLEDSGGGYDGYNNNRDDDGNGDDYSFSVQLDDRRGGSGRGRWQGGGQRSYDRGGSGGYGRGGGREGYAQDRPPWADKVKMPTVRDDVIGEVLYGVFPVLNAMKEGRRKVYALNVLSGLDLSKRKDAAVVRQIFTAAEELDIPVRKMGKHDLNLLTDDRPHQGLVLDCSAVDWEELDSFPSGEEAIKRNGGVPPVWIALDEVTDTQNLGAVIRSAFCLGAAGLLSCSKNCAPLSATVSKASAGAMEVMKVHSCDNMPKTLEDAVASGWQVLGAAAGTGSIDSRDVTVDKPTILVVGSEGKGLRTNVKRICTGFVQVAMGKSTRMAQAVDSLNVSVATGILLHDLLGSSMANKRGDQ